MPERVQSEGVYIYNNTYFIKSGSDPLFEINGEGVRIWNNAFLVEEGGRLARKVNFGWEGGQAVDMRGNVYSGAVSPNLIRFDTHPVVAELAVEGRSGNASHRPVEYALDNQAVEGLGAGIEVEHPVFPLAGEGIFGHVDPVPVVDFFDNIIREQQKPIGAGYRPAEVLR